ncbi:MAG TPA: small basic protein [Planctomycetota bacterium]|jgi:small basic protein (TIGR04137 family)|nr:small basic protein [Planctomycetota bacterium]
MSIHSSLRTRGKLVRERNVWSRLERILFLQKEGNWKEGASIFGLPKVRTRLKSAAKKKPKKAAAEPGAEGVAVAAAPTPAAKPSPAAAKAAAKEAAAERKKERGGKGAK